MKKLLSTLTILLFALQTNAQSAKFFWNTTIGSGGHEQGNSVITDPMGNVFTVGKFSGTVDFDPGPGVFFINSFGQTDAYVMKQDRNGVFLWARNFGGVSIDEATSISLDFLNNIYISGNFSGVVNFGGIGGTLNSMGGPDVFTLKLDPNGLFLWVRRTGFNGIDAVNSNHWDKAGFLYFTGTRWLNTSDMGDVFISKIDPNGSVVWTRAFTTKANDIGYSVATDKFGNVYTIGTFEGHGDFDFGTGETILATFGGKDIFISKISPSGNFLWAKQLGGPENEIGKSIHVTDSGNIYITGSFSGKTDFNPSILEADTNFIESKGTNDMFVAKLDLSGDLIWVNTIGSDSADCAGTSVNTDLLGNVVVSGVFTDSLDFDPNPSKTFSLKSAGEHDIFIAKYDYAGNFMWVKQMGGIYEDSVMGMNVEVSGGIISIGTFRDTVDFNPAKEVYKMSSKGNSDIFVNKLEYCTPLFTTIKDTSCEIFTLDGVTYDKTGIYNQTITSVSGCEEFVTLDLDIHHINDTVTVSASGKVLTSQAMGVKYQWIGCKTKMPIPGATGKSYIALGNAQYAVTLFDGRCRDTSACVDITSFPTSIEDFENQNKVSIYPNPSNGSFVIAIVENMIGSSATIYNLLGQKVRDIPLNQANTTQHLSQGFYVIEIIKENDKILRKVIVE